MYVHADEGGPKRVGAGAGSEEGEGRAGQHRGRPGRSGGVEGRARPHEGGFCEVSWWEKTNKRIYVHMTCTMATILCRVHHRVILMLYVLCSRSSLGTALVHLCNSIVVLRTTAVYTQGLPLCPDFFWMKYFHFCGREREYIVFAC